MRKMSGTRRQSGTVHRQNLEIVDRRHRPAQNESSRFALRPYAFVFFYTTERELVALVPKISICHRFVTHPTPRIRNELGVLWPPEFPSFWRQIRDRPTLQLRQCNPQGGRREAQGYGT